MPLGPLVESAQEALRLAVGLSFPMVLAAAAVSLVMGFVQTASQVQEPTLVHLPRWLVVAAVLAVTGPALALALAQFAQRILLLLPSGL